MARLVLATMVATVRTTTRLVEAEAVLALPEQMPREALAATEAMA